MELKNYLRGLGLGIVVTALIMGFSLSGKQTMTDEEIISRAKQLGMIEDTVLSAATSEEEENLETTEVVTNDQPDTDKEDISRVEEIQAEADQAGQNKNEEDTVVEERNEAEVKSEVKEISEAEKNEAEIVKADVKETADEPETEAETETADEPKIEAETAGNTVSVDEDELITSGASMTITISSGDGSYTVSKKLADIGAVSSAETYDKFLCQNGYDKKIRTGTYTIPADASDEQMARIITGVE